MTSLQREKVSLGTLSLKLIADNKKDYIDDSFHSIIISCSSKDKVKQYGHKVKSGLKFEGNMQKEIWYLAEDNYYTANRSDLGPEPYCPVCGIFQGIMNPHYDDRHVITHWTVACRRCGTDIKVIADR